MYLNNFGKILVKTFLDLFSKSFKFFQLAEEIKEYREAFIYVRQPLLVGEI